jgi:hypothetical protein
LIAAHTQTAADADRSGKSHSGLVFGHRIVWIVSIPFFSRQIILPSIYANEISAAE